MGIKRINQRPVGPIIPPPEPKVNKSGDNLIDREALSALLGKKAPKDLSAYFVGAPTWSAEAEKNLFGFVVSALSRNELFKDKPLALEETAKKVCEAIENSSNLTAKFLPFLKARHS